MKTFVAFVILFVGISASPKIQSADLRNDRIIVEGIVTDVINDITQTIQDAGLDPFNVNGEESYALPVSVIFSAEALVEDLLLTGLSNIVVNNVNYGLITSRLTFDIELPAIDLSIKNSAFGIVLFGSEFSASAAGSVGVSRIRVRGEARVSVGIITGISIRNLSINFTLGGIESSLNIVIQNKDFSNWVNNFLGDTIPSTLEAYSAELNELFQIIAMDLIDNLL